MTEHHQVRHQVQGQEAEAKNSIQEANVEGYGGICQAQGSWG